MSHSVRQHLRLDIDEYDETIRQWVPGYETMLETAALAAASVSPDRVVDLGSGTGALSAEVLKQEGVGHVELLDVDPEMMAIAQDRLTSSEDRVTFTLGSYYEPLPNADAFVACLALHHVETMERKAEVFQAIFDALPPGGVFANADTHMPADPEEAEATYDFWARHMGKSGISRDEAFGHFAAWADEDTYFPIEDEIDALERAGFMVQIAWRLGPESVVVARKPE